MASKTKWETKGAKRRAMDAYMTPLPLAQAITRRLQILGIDPRFVLEPSAGTGNFVRAVSETWPSARITALEPHAKRYDKLARLTLDGTQHFRNCSYEDKEVPALGSPGLILGNPPYSKALEHVVRSLSLGQYTAFLLRMSFLASQERVHSFWDVCKTQHYAGLRWLIPLAKRPSFTDDGKTDNSEYAIYVWERGYMGRANIEPHLWWDSEPHRVVES